MWRHRAMVYKQWLDVWCSFGCSSVVFFFSRHVKRVSFKIRCFCKFCAGAIAYFLLSFASYCFACLGCVEGNLLPGRSCYVHMQNVWWSVTVEDKHYKWHKANQEHHGWSCEFGYFSFDCCWSTLHDRARADYYCGSRQLFCHYTGRCATSWWWDSVGLPSDDKFHPRWNHFESYR